jgi:hypothetical protein
MAIKLGFGSYEPNSSEPASRTRARIDFFKVIEELEPQVVISLHERTFLIFLYFIYKTYESRMPPLGEQTESQALRHIRRTLLPEEVRTLIIDWQTLKENREAQHLCRRLEAWADSWRLREDWCLYFATRALHLWLFHSFTRTPPSWHYAYSGQLCDDDDLIANAIWDTTSLSALIHLYDGFKDADNSGYGFQFNYEGISFKSAGWNPFYTQIGEWKDAVKREFQMYIESLRGNDNPIPRGIKGAFTLRVDEHVNAVKLAAKAKGLKATPKKLDYTHFRWLVHYQVQEPNWSLQKIAAHYHADLKTVSGGIKSIAKIIGLTVRAPLPAGRKSRKG